MLSINNCVSQSTKKTPYEMVFGQPTRSDLDFWSELNKQYSKDEILNEEDLPSTISNLITLNDDQVFNFYLSESNYARFLQTSATLSPNNSITVGLPSLSSAGITDSMKYLFC